METARRRITAVLMFLIIATCMFSFVYLVLKPQCIVAPARAYEPFADADTDLPRALATMIRTYDALETELGTTIENVGDMKVQTCSIYDQFHNNYIQTKGSEVPDESEYSLPPEQQVRLQQNRMKYAEVQWNAKVNFFQTFYKQTMIDCSTVGVAGVQTQNRATEGFAPAVATGNLSEVQNLMNQLREKMAVFTSLLHQSSAKWLQDCKDITGTANFTNGNIQLIIQGMNPPKEGFDNASQEDFSARGLLVQAQSIIDRYRSTVGSTYMTALAAYRQLNVTYKNYLGYVNQLNNAHTATDVPISR